MSAFHLTSKESLKYEEETYVTEFYLLLYIVFIIYLFIYWLLSIFTAGHRLSVVTAGGGCSLSWGAGFSLRWFFLLQSTGYRMCRLQLCTGTGAQAQLFQCTGLAAPRHVGSS